MQPAASALSTQSDIAKNMQPQNLYVSSGNNSAGNTRSNQQSGIFRGPPPTANAPRGTGAGGPRHLHMPAMYPNVVLQQYSQYGQRQPTFQTPHIQYGPAPIPYYPYQYLPSLQQQPPPPPQHSRSGVATNASVNIGGNTMPVQTGPNGQLAGPGATTSQLQLLTGSVQTGANTVIGVGATGSGQVGVPPMVSVMPPNVAQQPVQVVAPASRRRHQHRLQIIHPETKKNILDELDKSNSNVDNEYQEQQGGAVVGTTVTTTTAAVVQPNPDVPICISQPDAASICLANNMLIQGPDSRANAQFKLDQIPAHRPDIIMGQTPVVSAMSDAPSVEILPTPQKTKSKKIPIVSPKDISDSSTAFSSVKLDDAEAAKANVKATVEINQQIQTDSVLQQKNQLNLAHPQAIQQQSQIHIQQQHSQYMAHVATPTPEFEHAVDDASVSSSQSELFTNCPLQNIEAEPETTVDIAKIATAAQTQTNVEVSSEGESTAMQIVDQSSEIEAAESPAAVALTPTAHSTHESTPDETDRAGNTQFNEAPIKANDNVDIGVDTSMHSKQLATNNTMDGTEQEVKQEQEQEQDLELELELELKESVGDGKEPRSKTVEQQTATSPPTAAIETDPISSLINYNDGQWSPSNPSGKKQYDRQQLLQLREAKASRVQPEVKNVAILPHPNLMPTFMRNINNNNNKRVQSMVGMIGSNRNSDASSNFVGKQVSMSGVQGGGRSSMKGMIHVNLSLNQDVKLNETENAWRPRLTNKAETDASSDGKSVHEKDELVRRVRGILNKLTPERFDTLVEEIVKLKIDTPDKMDEVIVLVFEKAIDEPNFSVSYARLCHRLISEVKARDERMESGTKSNLQHFRNALLDKTEKEFTQNVSQGAAKEKKLQPIVEKIKKCTDPNEKAEIEALLEEEERKIRRRSGGTVRFIGELFKISMLTGKIIYSCIDTLLNPHSEDMLECLCKLLTTVGAKFEQTPVITREPSRCYSLDKPITRMQAIASRTDKDGAKVSSRVRFMLQDVIDLRKNKWQSARNEAPKTMGQIEKEAKNEQLSAQYMNYSGSLSTSSSNGPQSGAGKRDERTGGARYSDSRSAGYGGSHSQRGDGSNNVRHQQPNSGGSGNSGNSGGGTNANSNGNNDDNTWHVQTSKGGRSQAVDTNKLEGLSLQLNQNLDTKKMGGLNQFIWNHTTNRQSSTPTTTPSNSFAVLSSLNDKNSIDRDRDRDRDRSGPRNKSSFNKGSMERDRYGDRGIHSRTGSSQGSRENSSSRVGQNQQGRGMMNASLQKSASHSKYTQQAQPSRLSNKAMGSSMNSSTAGVGGIYRGGDQQQQQPPSSSATPPAKSLAPQTMYIKPQDNDIKLFKTVVTDIIDQESASKSVTPTVVECIKRIPEPQRCGFMYYILTDYLHLSKVGKQYRRYLAITIAHLIQQNYMSVDHFKLAYREFSVFAHDLLVDVPEMWLYIFQFAGPLIVKKVLTVSDLWNNNLRDHHMGKQFLKAYLTYCTREVGPNFTRSMWKKFNMHWSDFMPESEAIAFIESNRLEYVENESKAPVIEDRESPEKHVKNVIDHIEHLLKEGATADCIIDYCNGNIVLPDKLFIRGLTTILSNFAIVYKDNDISYKLEPEVFQKICIPVFQRYIDSNEDLQLECLYGVQLLVHGYEHPRGLLNELFGELYDGFVIHKESLYKWRDSKDQSAGKGVAVKSLNTFFNSLNDDVN
ncbi:eukaryotic translation initiation factor 4 gamma 3 [Drosophila grimshawi]|uniref:eukaryotic translation initiation factor 4 gamma 3 n=1 Tax=Drosophila grimshawi TaxID=7222 RepID=UPI000C86E945|nr:eukaryotic translation initiation factor 4 gamma 3 [Drosophila grimshawi]